MAERRSVTGFLIDTNVLSELRRPKPNQFVRDFFVSRNADELFVSAVTMAEIRAGIDNAATAELRARLRHWLDHQLRAGFQNRVLPVDEDVLVLLIQVMRRCQRAGRSIAVADGLIAATALQHGLTVVSRDTAPFDVAGVAVVNPWA